MPRAPKLKPGIWRKCTMCGDYVCTLHNKHAYDRPCPSIEVWSERGVDPYADEDDEEDRA